MSLNKIRILMISRATLYTSPGGDTIQILSTAKYLIKLGILVDVKLTNDVIKYEKYDLIHFFNLIRPADILPHIKLSNKKFVVSTIFVDYEEFERYARKGIYRLVAILLSSDMREYLKTIIRFYRNNELINSKYFLLNGQKKSIDKILKKCACILPNSYNEKERIYMAYGVKATSYKIPNAIDMEIFNNKSNIDKKYTNSIICVARIEGRKNQLNLIKALKNEHIKLFIIGKPSPNNIYYYDKCKKEANEYTEFIDHVSQEELSVIYRSAKVHALASWFETTGLVSLEAAYCGCNIVITKKGDQEEYFKDFGYFCDPGDINSIREAVLEAYSNPYNENIKETIAKNYSWENTALETLEAYEKVLNLKDKEC